MSKDRLQAFSDGVIAILITIMVLELHTPDGTDWQALRHELPVLLAYVPEELQLTRLVDGRGLDAARARAMIASQMPIDEKRKLAPHVIDNSGSRESTRQQVKRIWDALL